MSKKDYELIARVLRAHHLEGVEDAQADVVASITNTFARELAGTNPRFDRSRFLAACMGEDSTDSAGRRVRYSAAS